MGMDVSELGMCLQVVRGRELGSRPTVENLQFQTFKELTLLFNVFLLYEGHSWNRDHVGCTLTGSSRTNKLESVSPFLFLSPSVLSFETAMSQRQYGAVGPCRLSLAQSCPPGCWLLASAVLVQGRGEESRGEQIPNLSKSYKYMLKKGLVVLDRSRYNV